MKGIAVTAESIIVIVLAVLVLAAFIIFFGSAWNPSQGEVNAAAEQSRLCTEYVKFDPDCNDAVTTIDTKIPGISANISVVGQRLGFSSCSSGSSLACNQDVCHTWCV